MFGLSVTAADIEGAPAGNPRKGFSQRLGLYVQHPLTAGTGKSAGIFVGRGFNVGCFGKGLRIGINHVEAGFDKCR